MPLCLCSHPPDKHFVLALSEPEFCGITSQAWRPSSYQRTRLLTLARIRAHSLANALPPPQHCCRHRHASTRFADRHLNATVSGESLRIVRVVDEVREPSSAISRSHLPSVSRCLFFPRCWSLRPSERSVEHRMFGYVDIRGKSCFPRVFWAAAFPLLES